MSIKMCFWVEVNMFFVLQNYYDIIIIIFVFVGLERKVFAIPQLSPTYNDIHISNVFLLYILYIHL